jgi:chromosome segregation protein
MHGFKSFADKTELYFDQQIVGIVGPNGCGKSNIVDCIRWAMGEQSAKGLRGKEMSDVIFAGTPSRKAAGFAEVSLIFDNADRQAPAPYTDCAEVMITRRLYRTGESEYQINKVNVRLKDVHDIFLGTGSSAKAYSIVAQGKVDQVVLAKPEERRFLIEEAAGIAKYKVRKQAAERKIETTQQNLDRVNDILRELERSSKSLERQVEKAEKYRELQKSLKSKECDFLAARLKRLDESATANQEALDSTQAGLIEKQAFLQKCEAEIERLRLETLNQEKLTSGDYESLMAGKDRLAKLETDRELAQQKIQLLTNQIADRKTDLERIGSKFEDQEGSRKTLLEELQKIQDEKSRADERLQMFREAMEKANVEVAGAEKSLADANSRLQDLKSEMAARVQRLEMLKAELVDLELQRAERERRYDLAQQQSEQLRVEEALLLSQSDEKMQEIQQQKLSLDQLRSDKERLLEEKSERLAEKLQLESRLFEKETQIQNLQSLEVHSLGYDPMALEMKNQTGQKFLMDRIQFKLEYRQIGEVLVYHLGQYFTEDLTSALDTPRWTSLFVTEAADFPSNSAEVLIEGETADEVREILRRIEFVDELQAAGSSNFPQIDRAGRWRTPLGSGLSLRSCGLISKEQSPFGRQQELLDFQGEVESLRAELQSQASRIEQNRQSLESNHRETEIQAKNLQNLEREKENLLLQRDRFLQKGAANQSLQTQLQSELQDCDTKIGEKQKALDLIPAEMDLSSNEAEIQDRRLQLDAAKAELQKRESEWVEYRIQVGALQERMERLQEQCISVDMAQSEYRHNQDVYHRDIEVWAQEIERLKESSQLAGEEAESLRTRLQDLELSLAKAKEEMSGVRQALAENEESRRSFQGSKEELSQILANLELERQRYRLEAEEISRALEDRYQLSAAELLGNLSPEELQGLADLSLSELELEVKSLRDRINRFGDVNLVALSEYEEIKGRLDFMTAQREDLLKTLDSLQSIIDRINRISEFRFRETFAAINHNFQLLFPKLFGGGKAYMRLTDENNMLDTGVEIFAEPPGKKIQAMSLLSGGEKAMTSISLLFSLFAYRPSSFCILDEVDAPLDDINTRRYNQIIQEMASLSQFIVITHNKRTMEVASTLFGVTMQEPGCSRIVGVNLNEAKAFTTTAATA